MTAPNREADVAALCRQHPEAFPSGEQNDPARLRFLLTVLIPSLNARDDGRWGYMTKTDQAGKIPCDVLMWWPTLEVVDCLTGTGPAWVVHPPPPPAWEWTAVERVVPDPGDPDPPSDGSVPVFYAAAAPMLGTIVPQPAGFVVLINVVGEVASMQPDGHLEWRPPGTVGSYELATRVGNLLLYSGAGQSRSVLTAAR